ncbi:hypothetical protein [uncultured Salegentibacter sp.]|uniref:hypothetical protein n=1 Tax=uncultured Salegentibacter sp. TaxID=259320 RepID=UPI002593FAEE|nr:hypothetical protein [uncultured Salegentibacter sp.]
MKPYTSPLRKGNCQDLFSAESVQNDLAEFTFDYRFSGTRRGEVIDFFVFTWVIDSDENIFIRYCSYMGNSEGWKKVIEDQIKQLMGDINIGSGFIKGSLRFFNVDNNHHREPELFEKEFLELKAKIL